MAVFVESGLVLLWQLPENGFGCVVLLPLEEDAAEIAPKGQRHIEVVARTVLLWLRGRSPRVVRFDDLLLRRFVLERFGVRLEPDVVNKKIIFHCGAGNGHCEGTLELLGVHFLVRVPPLDIIFVDEVDGLSPRPQRSCCLATA